MGDDDWELFVPVIGERYPEGYQYAEHGKSKWHGGSVVHIKTPRNDVFQYRKPKQKENKMPDRTPQQVLKDAIDSGAVDAWINGEDIQCDAGGIWKDYERREGLTPNFQHSEINWKPSPPEPTRINWRPVVTGKEPKGWVLCTWKDTSNYVALCRRVPQEDPHDQDWEDAEGTYYDPPTHWAPMCNLPE